MGIISLITDVAGQVGQQPRRVKMITTDNLATVTTAGYLNVRNLQGQTLQPTDIIDAWYGYINGSDPGTYAVFNVAISNGVITLSVDAGGGRGPFVDGDFANFVGTSGEITDSGFSPSDATKTKVVMAGSAVQVGYLPHFVDVSGTIDDTPGAVINAGNIQAGLDSVVGGFISYSATTASGTFKFQGVANSGAYNVIFSNSAFGQNSTISVPDPGASSAKVLLDTGINPVASIANLKYGATPVAQVDPASCTISAAAGASNTATITVQLKDGSGTNLAYSMGFKVYASSASNGLTLASAASTGFSVASGGLSLANGSAVTTQISCISSASGGCVLSLLDTGKQTSYLVLVLHNGIKISAQLSSGSYGA